MSVLVFTATIAPEHVEEVEAAGRTVFAAVEAAKPAGFRYSTCRLDANTYLTLLELPDGQPNPLQAMPEYQEFLSGLRGWLVEPSKGGPATVIGSYRLFGED